MKFPHLGFAWVLVGVTLITLLLIFGVYRIFLYQPSPPKPSPTPRPSFMQVTQEVSPSTLPKEATPAASAIPTPKPSPRKSTIGTLTVIKDVTSSTSPISNSNISGTISFSGSAPSGTSIVIVARPNGTQENFKTVVSGISASNNAAWSWSGAQISKAYDLIAVLKGSSGGVDTDYATSQTYVVTAPALNQVFFVNAVNPPSAPTGSVTTTCKTHNSNNTWAATVNFPTVSNAEWYKLQVGTTSEGTDIADTAQAEQSGNNQTVNVTLNDSIAYYAQYSVSNASNPTPYQYSEFSEPQTIRCP